MSIFNEWISKLRYLNRRNRFDGEIADEVAFHIETRAAELQEQGVSQREALRRARREFGSVVAVHEDSRTAWQIQWMEDLAADLRYAWRAFRRSPGFTITAVLSLALGIGANSMIFAALDAVLWKPLPIDDPERLVRVVASRPGHDASAPMPLAFLTQLRQAKALSGVTAITGDGLSFSYDDRAERILGEAVRPSYCSVVGVRTAIGQCFTPEVQSGRWAPEAVLSYNFWKRRFGGDPNIIGRTIRLNTLSFTIVGVTPAGFYGTARGLDYDLRVPILPDGREIPEMALVGGRSNRTLATLARIPPGVDIARATAEADALFQEFLRTTTVQRFRDDGYGHLRLVPEFELHENLRQFQTPLYVLLALVAIVLLIACANVASMLLARATTRAREVGVRAAIGASRWRLVRQMLAESTLLSLFGGALGVAIAEWNGNLLIHFMPKGHIPILLDLTPDSRVLAATVAISFATGIIFGLFPALNATRGDLAAALKTDSAASAGGGHGAGIRKTLVGFQVAFSLALVISAGVFVRTSFDLRPRKFVANPERVLLFTMKPQREIYTDEKKMVLGAELIRRVSAIPGVASAALAEFGPLGSREDEIQIETPTHAVVTAGNDIVTPGFFATAGIPWLGGRDFTANDNATSPHVAIINRSLGRALFGEENPVGRRLVVPRQGTAPWEYEIVGLVADTEYFDPRKGPVPMAWFAIPQYPLYMPTLHVRTNDSNAAAMTTDILREFNAIDKGFPVFNIKTMETRIEESLSRERMVANLAGVFGILALALAAVGIYGVLAYSVTRRTREIGIRVALGCRTPSLLWMVAREALMLVAIGTGAGTLIALFGYVAVKHYMGEVSAPGAGVLLAGLGAISLIAAAAVSVPAIRACRVDPLTALRHS